MGKLISGNGWPDCYQERKLSNHVAMAQLLEGVAVSYLRAPGGCGRDNHYLGKKKLWLYKNQR
jgi:hypothetical protein